MHLLAQELVKRRSWLFSLATNLGTLNPQHVYYQPNPAMMRYPPQTEIIPEFAGAYGSPPPSDLEVYPPHAFFPGHPGYGMPTGESPTAGYYAPNASVNPMIRTNSDSKFQGS